jgi:hypothetical protein
MLFVDLDSQHGGPADLDRITDRADDAQRFLSQTVRPYLDDAGNITSNERRADVSTLTMPQTTADDQTKATTKAVATPLESLPFDFQVVYLGLDRSTATEHDEGETVRRVLSVEARVRLSAQDEEYDLSFIRDADLRP